MLDCPGLGIDETLIAWPLGESRMINAAGTSYLARCGTQDQRTMNL
ncbi:hypothetical protein [Pandoraea sp.]|nr:hypothetical protein [Pandoraea sp.]